MITPKVPDHGPLGFWCPNFHRTLHSGYTVTVEFKYQTISVKNPDGEYFILGQRWESPQQVVTIIGQYS